MRNCKLSSCSINIATLLLKMVACFFTYYVIYRRFPSKSKERCRTSSSLHSIPLKSSRQPLQKFPHEFTSSVPNITGKQQLPGDPFADPFLARQRSLDVHQRTSSTASQQQQQMPTRSVSSLDTLPLTSESSHQRVQSWLRQMPSQDHQTTQAPRPSSAMSTESSVVTRRSSRRQL